MINGSLVLYGTSGCHLCELAEQLLLPWVVQGMTVELVDIADDEALVDRYGVVIPVLERNDGQILSWPFDDCSLRRFIVDPITTVDQAVIVDQAMN